MAVNDITIRDVGGKNTVATMVWQTEANATAILPGEPVKNKSTGSPYAIPVADGEPVIGTLAVPFLGIAKSASTQTATADGTVEVYMIDPNVVLRAKAKTASTADTQSEINALCGNGTVFDLTAGVYTIDAAAAHANANGLIVVGGDPNGSYIDFVVRASTIEGPVS